MEATPTTAAKTIEQMNAEPHHISSTGMVHRQGCGALTAYRSVVRLVTAEAAAKIAKRCKHCNPRPLGTIVAQDDRRTATAIEREVAEQAHTARLAEQAAAWAALQSPELDALLLAFLDAEAAEAAGTGTFEQAKAAWQAMGAVEPAGWNHSRRAAELGR